MTRRQRLNAMGATFMLSALGCAALAYFSPSLQGLPLWIQQTFDPSLGDNQEGYYAIGGLFAGLSLFCFFR